jgi:hypothetical protein
MLAYEHSFCFDKEHLNPTTKMTFLKRILQKKFLQNIYDKSYMYAIIFYVSALKIEGRKT